jgi:hypothetical protein
MRFELIPGFLMNLFGHPRASTLIGFKVLNIVNSATLSVSKDVTLSTFKMLK